jgi:hypothetical protein
MKAPKAFDVYTQKFTSAVRGDYQGGDDFAALQAESAGVTINSVSGTAIGGTRTSASIFTRSSGVWIDRVIIPISSVSGTFVDGETVTETTSSSTGVIESVSDTMMVLHTISAAFSGAKTLTGSTSGATATGGTATNVVTDLKSWLVWSHASGTTTAGTTCRVVSNTSSAITVDGTLHATGTAVILFQNEQALRDAMDIEYGTSS